MIVSGHHEPAFTVASFATTTTIRGRDYTDPVMTPAAGRLSIVLVVRDEEADLEECACRVHELRDALAGGELALGVLFRCASGRPPAGAWLQARDSSLSLAARGVAGR